MSGETKEFITEDLRSFWSNFKTKKGQSAGFKKVNGMVYVCQPGIYVPFSSVAPTNLANWGIELKELQCKRISVCHHHSYHDFLLPFIDDNNTLLLKYSEINTSGDETRKEANKDRFDKLMSIKNDGHNHQHTPYHCSGSAFCNGSYTEVEWTLRLFHSLTGYTPQDFKLDLTYDAATNFAIFQEQYSKCETSGYYLFQGAPEMVLFPRNVMSGGASVMLNEVDVIEVKKNELHHTRSSTMPIEVRQMIASLLFLRCSDVAQN